jgi:outer membrane protein OmpA-like peptidoglycan-associated protein
MRLLPFLLLTTLCSQAQKFTVNFDFNKSNISSKASAALDSFMLANKTVSKTISLFGHTDSKGSNAYNIALSQRRVKAVEKYLVSKGFDANLLQKETALGETNLLEINDADETVGEINRRVELVMNEQKKQKTDRTIKEMIEDNASKKGTTLVLKNMQFEGGRHKILPSSLPQLRELLTALQNNKNLKIAIEGHICCLEGNVDGEDFDTGTRDLSMQRAKAIYEYLILSGISETRLSYKGFGHSAPIIAFPEKDENEKTINRRVEIKIVDK